MNQDRTLQEAARRQARAQAHDCSPEEQEDARAWEAQSAEHAAAGELSRKVLGGVDQLAAHEAFRSKLQALADDALNAYAVEPCERPQTNRWRLAAGIAAGFVLTSLAWQLHQRQVTHEIQESSYATTQHERRSITLPDGSVVQLDVGTELAVRMSEDKREIDLLSGRALFQVAHDATRPFSVSTETSRTTALGTQFQVQRDDDHVVVTLAEGSVAVEGSAHGGSASWQDQLRPGEQLSIDAKTAERSLHIVDTQLVTSWTLGRHVFRATPLHEALDEVNRYASKKVRLGDPSLADLPVAGNFVAGDSEVVVEAFSAVLPLRVVKGGEQELILFRRYSE
jgi:transmembrane sensor